MNLAMISAQFTIDRVPLGRCYHNEMVALPSTTTSDSPTIGQGGGGAFVLHCPSNTAAAESLLLGSVPATVGEKAGSHQQPLLTAMRKCNLEETSAKKEFWHVRDRDGAEEELYANDRTVVWTRFSQLADRFPMATTLDSPVVAVCWSSFLLPEELYHNSQKVSVFDNPPGRCQTGVGIFESERFTFLTDKGERFSAKMPCQVSAAWPVANGILVERRPSEDLDDCPIRKPLFSIFTITHPLDEITPVILKVPGPNSTWKISFATDVNERIIFVSKNPPLVVTCDVTTNLHSIWRFKTALPAEYNDLYTVGVDGLASVAPHAMSHNTSTVILPASTTPHPITPNTTAGIAAVAATRCLSPFAASLSRLKAGNLDAQHGHKSNYLSTPTRGGSFLFAPHQLAASKLTSFTETQHSAGSSTIVHLPEMKYIRSPLVLNEGSQGHPSGCQTILSEIAGEFYGGANAPPLEEPLLPQACLELLWTEGTVPIGGGVGAGAAASMFQGSRVTTPIVSRGGGHLLNQPQQIYSSTPAAVRVGDGTRGGGSGGGGMHHTPINGGGGNLLPCTAPPTSGRHLNTRGFLAEDFSGSRWVCFHSHRLARLTCVRLETVEAMGSAESRFVLGATTVIRARDAVYLPASKLCVVLEPGGSQLILYSGIKKMCVLGATPPPVVNQSSSFGLPNLLDRAHEPLRLPLAVMSSGRRSSMLNSTQITAEPLGRYAMHHFQDKISSLSPVPVSGPSHQQQYTHNQLGPSTCQGIEDLRPSAQHATAASFYKPGGPPMWSLREPSGRAFSVEVSSGRLVRCYLPEMADTRLVKRCLTALQKILPKDLGLQLLTQWYTLHNAPGHSPDTQAEWAQFSSFLLGFAGFQSTGDQVPRSTATDIVESQTGGARTTAKAQPAAPVFPPQTPPAKRQRADGAATDEDWDFLLASVDPATARHYCLHQSDQLEGATRPPPPSSALDLKDSLRHNAVSSAPLLKHLPTVLFALHIVYEDEKLNMLSWEDLDDLAVLNCSISQCLGLTKYCEYYAKDLHNILAWIHPIPQIDTTSGTGGGIFWPAYMDGNPADLLAWIDRFLSSPSSLHPPYPYLPGVNELSRQLVTAFLVMNYTPQWADQITLMTAGHAGRATLPSVWDTFIQLVLPSRHRSTTGQDTDQPPAECLRAEHLCHRLVLYLSHVGVTSDILDRLPGGLAAIFRTAMADCRSDPPANCSPVVYALIGREDLSRQMSVLSINYKSSSSRGEATGGKKKTAASVPIAVEEQRGPVGSTSSSALERWSQLVEPLWEVPRRGGREAKHPLLAMLETDPAVQLAFKDDLRIREAYRLLQSTNRVKLRVSPRPEATEQEMTEELDSHLLAASVRTMALSVGRGMLGLAALGGNLPARLPLPKLCLNGKAQTPGRASTNVELSRIDTPANMSVWPEFHNGVATGLMISQQAPIDATWIMYNCRMSNKPAASSTGTAASDVQLTSERAGLLLALGLQGHLNRLSLCNIREVMIRMHDISNMAVLLGLCAGRRGSMDEALTRLVAVHLKRLLPASPLELEVPSLGQAAAVMGLGLVYQGSAHPHMARLLLEEIGKPPGPDLDASMEREVVAVTAGCALGLVMLQKCETSFCVGDFNMAEKLHAYMVGGHRSPDTYCPDDRDEADLFSATGRTGAGGSSGGGNTNGLGGGGGGGGGRNTGSFVSGSSANPQIREGDRFNVDVTAPAATVALGLMFFGSANECVAGWLRVPDTQYQLDFVRPDLLLLRMVALGLVMWHRVKPTEAWIASHLPPGMAKYAFKKQAFRDDVEAAEVDFETMSLSCLNTMAGCCFVIGLRFAGTGHPDAANTLRKVIGILLDGCANLSNLDEVGKPQMEQAVAIVVLSLSMVMSGSGNLEVLKIIRKLRSRIGPQTMFSVNYGCQMMYAMATGLLFLGGGKLTLSNTPEAAAILLIAFFPRFPSFSSDNRYHLQALRHLYVLATEPRRLSPVDVDTNKVVPSNMCAIIKDTQETLTSKGTVILPSNVLDKLEMLEVNHKSEEFWSHQFRPECADWDILKRSLNEGGYIFVKRKDSNEDSLTDEWDLVTNIKVLLYLLNIINSHLAYRLLLWSTSLHVALNSNAQISHHLDRWLSGRHLWQIKLAVVFARRTHDAALPRRLQALADTIKARFLERRSDLRRDLLAYYGPTGSLTSPLVCAFLIWFSLPSRQTLTLDILPSTTPPTMAFIKELKQMNLTLESALWLHKIVYSS